MTKKINRRRFLAKTASAAVGTIAFPYIVSSSALGKDKSVAPSNRIVMGCIGVGWQGTTNLHGFLSKKDCRVVAVCDVDSNHLRSTVNLINEKYGNQDCAGYNNFRELLARSDIDAVSIALPDHWHAVAAIDAAKSGKDIYGEKPLSHSLAEGRAICDAVKRYGRVWQTGSWQRSEDNFRFACELVLNGYIGKVRTVEVGLPPGHIDFAGTKGQESPGSAPAELDYDRWLGPAPYAPYCPARVHKNWRWILDYGGGQLMDWVGHHVDIAHWGLGLDYNAPVEIEGSGKYPKTGLWDSPTKYRLTSKYANGVKMIIAGGYADIRGGTKWVGEEGWVLVNRSGIDAHPKNLLNEKISTNKINLYHSPGHYRNFLDCVRSRSLTLAPCEVAHRSATPGHLGNIAMKLGKKICFDPEKEVITNDSEANYLLNRSMRSPWHL